MARIITLSRTVKLVYRVHLLSYLLQLIRLAVYGGGNQRSNRSQSHIFKEIGDSQEETHMSELCEFSNTSTLRRLRKTESHCTPTSTRAPRALIPPVVKGENFPLRGRCYRRKRDDAFYFSITRLDNPSPNLALFHATPARHINTLVQHALNTI